MKINLKNKKILVTGGAGFLGIQVVKKLIKLGVPKKNIKVPRFKDCDLRSWENCQRAVAGQNIVIHLAAVVGGIEFNIKRPGKLYFDNLIMGTNMIEAARQAGIEKFQTVSSICAYPKSAPVPFQEENFWDGYLEKTNAAYGFAKKMPAIQLQAYRQEYGFNGACAILANLYGPGDEFDPVQSHVIPAIIRKIAEAKSNNQNFIEMWGTGVPLRDFLYVEDAADGIISATEKYHQAEPVNIGSGREISIKNLTKIICEEMGFKGKIKWDRSKPDGQFRRSMDVSRAKKEFNFKAKTDFKTGIKKTLAWFNKNYSL